MSKVQITSSVAVDASIWLAVLTARCRGLSCLIWSCRHPWQVPPRRLGYSMALLPLTGVLHMQVRGRAWQASPGQALCVAAGETHTMALAHRDAELTVLCVHAHWLDPTGLPLPEWLPEPLLTVPVSVRDGLMQVAGLPTARRPQAIEHWLRQWWLLVQPSLTEPRHAATDPRVRQACILMLADLECEPLLVPALSRVAAAVGLSPARFRQRFKEDLQVSPKCWLQERRLEAAARWLQDDVSPVSTVAVRAGFASVAQFGRAFKQWAGCTPSVWRRGLGG